MNIFVFPNAVSRKNDKEKLKLNIHGSQLTMILDESQVVIDTDLIRNGSSTMVMHNPITDSLYVLYNFREILQVLDMSPLEMMHTFNNRGFMQIDKSGDDLFIKVFLLKGDVELLSDTTDFSMYKHCTVDYIHPLDWQYSWTLNDVKGKLTGNTIDMSFMLLKSDFWQEDVYISHAGQSIKLNPGYNRVSFKYIPTELAYIGALNCRYKGRAIDIERLLYANK